MSEPDHHTLESIAAELTEMSRRLDRLAGVVQHRVNRPAPHVPEERELFEPPASTPPIPPSPNVHPAPAAPSWHTPPAPPPVGATGGQQEPRPVGHGWTPSRLLAWIGGAVTLLGVVFLLVLAVQRGWLGPATRVLGGAGLGIALLTVAFRVRGRPGGTSGSYALAATGFAVFYLDTVAATVLYDYLPTFGGITAGFVIAGGGLLLSDRWRAQPVAVGVVMGCAVCAPLVTGEPNATLVGFLALLHLVATPVQLRHGWRQLARVAAFPVVLAAILADAWAMLTTTDHIAVVAVVSTTSLLGIVVATLTAALRPDDNTSIVALVAAPIPVLLATPLLVRPLAATLAAGVAVVLTILWGLRFVPSWRFAPSWGLLQNQRDRLPAKFTTAAGGIAAVAAMQSTMTSLDASAWATALLCEALLLTSGALWLRNPGVLLGALCYATVGTVMALHHDIPPWQLVLVSHSEGVAGILVGVSTALVAVTIPVVGVRLGALSRPPAAKALWILAGVLMLYGTASATMALVSLFQQDRSGFLTGYVSITLSWVVVAIALLLRGITMPSLRIAGMVLLPAALTKLFLFDLATLDGFARVVAFMCTGLVLLAAGVRYARALSADSPVG
ncbi:DUF2339 domain-containing protein [Actinopolyspora sp. H202]|uniref:DUF2339 domain-containing protein n=1 Tax=Actinopolyspora sp. H202 TaxID=1500456 RepID=UPI003EE68B40